MVRKTKRKTGPCPHQEQGKRRGRHAGESGEPLAPVSPPVAPGAEADAIGPGADREIETAADQASDDDGAAGESASGGMKVEMVDVNSLHLDPANVRLHNNKNLDAIRASLTRFGQQKPIVVDANNVVRAGNGTFTAAKQLGWKQIQIVRSNLAGSEATAYAIADNRSAELAEWDPDLLASQLGSLHEDGVNLLDVGFDDEDLKKLLGDELEGKTEGQTLPPENWMVVVTCQNEAQQTELLQRFNDEGLQCKALVG